MRLRPRTDHGFSLPELAALAAILAVLGMLAAARYARLADAARSSVCDGHLGKFVLLTENWSMLNGDRELPEHYLTNQAGSSLTVSGYFNHVSNSVFHPAVFQCPDDRRRAPLAGKELNDSQVSYFARLGSTRGEPSAWLGGDRSLLVNDSSPAGLAPLAATDRLKWSRALHRGKGGVALRDGSLLRPSLAQLESAHPAKFGATNVVLFPK